MLPLLDKITQTNSPWMIVAKDIDGVNTWVKYPSSQTKSTAGLYIAGCILPHLLPLLHQEIFLRWFNQTGRSKNLLQQVPILIIINERAPLLGAGYYGIHAI